MSDEVGRNKAAKIIPESDKSEENSDKDLKDDDNGDVLTMQSTTTSTCYVHRLPDEIWMHIFDMIKNSNDLSSCSKTCLRWKRILSDRPPFAIKFDEIFPMLSPFLNRSELLKCREINTLWKNSVDISASKRPEVLPINSVKPFNGRFGNHPDRDQWFLDPHPLKRAEPQSFNTVANNPHWNSFCQTEKLQSFYEKFSTWNEETNQLELATMNPFISRSIFLYFFDKPDDFLNSTSMLNRSSALEFLTRFGRHIWSITLGGLSWNQLENQEESLVLALHDCLMELPNLNYLDFGFTLERNHSNFDVSILHEKLRKNPLPLLTNLETLRFTPSFILLPIQLYLLEQYASQVKRLDLFEDQHREKPWAFTPSAKFAFPVLRELNMSLDRITTALIVLPVFATAPLESLIIKVKMEVDEENMKILMETISSLFGETLRVFYLNMNHEMYSKAAPFSPPVEVLLPKKLESLTLSGCSNLSFNSLLRLADSLKYLTLEVHECNLPVFSHPNEIINVRKLITLYVPTTCEVYLSNVWDLFPKLNELVFHVLWAKRLVFTREKWESNKNRYGFFYK